MTQKVVTVPEGVVLAAEEPVYTIAGRITVYVPLARDDVQNTYRQWRQTLSSMERGLSKIPTNNTSFLVDQGNRMVKRHYQRAAEDLKETFPLPSLSEPPRRHKRGLFNFVGDIASSLFGTPSASDLACLQEAQTALASNVDQIVETQQQTIAVVNTLNENQRRIAGSLNRVTQQVNELSDKIARSQQELNMRALMDEIISELNSFRIALARYGTWSDKMTSVRAACESDSISELVISTDLLNKLIKPDDIVSYYQYLHTDKIMMYNETLYCVVNVPLFRSTQDQLYVIETYPVCRGDSCHKIYHNEQVVVDPLSEVLYFPEECIGHHPLACRPSVEFSASTQPCLHGLINGDPGLQNQCPATIYRDHPLPIPGRMPGENTFAVATPDTVYRYLCPDQRPRTGSLASGVYLITIEPGCALDANLWRLSGKTHRTYYAAKPTSFPKPLNITITIPTESLIFPEHLAVLEIDEVEKLSQPDSPHTKATIYNLHARLANNQDFWQWVVLTIIILIAIFLVYRKYRARMSCPFPKILKKTAQPPVYSPETSAHYVASTSTVRLYPDLSVTNYPTAPEMTEVSHMTQTDPEDL